MPTAVALRYAADWRGARIARRFFWTGVITPTAATAGTNLMGLRKTAANPEVFISRIRSHTFQVGVATAAGVVGWRRATTVAGGTAVTAADIPEVDNASVIATLEVRTGAVTGTKANQYILTHMAGVSLVTSIGQGNLDTWEARDLSERIRLTADEGLILDYQSAGDVDCRIHISLVWEEVT